ncbi:MAG: VOC family protein [Acidobacteria bacterium]|nr:VOC family protein [Acidobacteriota bacterium]
MAARVTHSTPMLHVAEIERSIVFYELLGFRLIDDDGCKPIGWARLHCDSGDIMFLRAEKPVDSAKQAFLFYLYTPDLAGLREHLVANNVAVPEIKRPAYMPSGTVNLADPDGYRIEIGHWGEAEQAAWVQHLEARTSQKL